MALNFSKMNFSVSFNPTSAFPLDARSYFESYDLALAAAAKAVEAGSTEGTLYFGQTIAVVENGAAQLYIIQPDKTLTEVGSKVVVDENAFELDEDGTLKLLGLTEAEEGAQLVKSKDGSLIWVKPDTTTVDGLAGAVETLEEELGKTNAAIDETNAEIEKLNQALNPTDEEGNPVEGGLVADVENLETKVSDIQEDIVDINDSIADIESKIGDPANSELGQEATGLYAALELKADKAITYTKTEVATLIEEKIIAANHLRRIIVDSKEAIDKNADDALLYIYMAPSGLEEDDNKYYEYIVLEADDGFRSIERVGSWEVNLDAYALKTEVSSLADVVATNKTIAENTIAAEQTRAEKVEADLAQDIIDAVNAEKERAEEVEQGLIDDLANLDATKANKADVYTKKEVYSKSEVYTKGEADQAIADKISEVNGGESAGEVLGQLNAYKKIVNMEVWGDESGSGDENGNSRIDLLEADVNALAEAEKNFIADVTEDFTVNQTRVLSLNDIAMSKVTGLNDAIGAVQTQILSLDKLINGYEDEEGNTVVGLIEHLGVNYAKVSDFNNLINEVETLKTDRDQIQEDILELQNLLTWNEMSAV